MKDNFSGQAKQYANFRPHYPKRLYDFIFSHVKIFDKALDLATGNGQVAAELSKQFKEVYATDISEKQLAQAPQLSNVFYKTERAEQTSFEDNYFDLITVAQAVHWFQFDEFYNEVHRILKDDGLIVIIGYGLLRINAEIDKWTDYFYTKVVGPYWDRERRYIDEKYMTIPFPFLKIQSPELSMNYNWNKEQFIGYLNTWSALQHYIKANGTNPLSEELLAQLNDVWHDDEIHEVRFPLFTKAGRKISL